MGERKRPQRGLFVGRIQAMADLEAALLSDRHDAVDLIGPPGIGKRTLLRRVLERESVRRRFGGGVVVFRERPFRPWIGGLAAYHAAGSAIPQDDVGLLSDALIVLDAPSSARGLRGLAESVLRSESNRLVTISSEGFHLPARTLPVEALPEGEAIDLLQALAPSIDRRDATAVVAAIGGVPLALRLAAGTLEQKGLRTLATLLAGDGAGVEPIDTLVAAAADVPRALAAFPAGVLPRGSAVVARSSGDDLSHWLERGWLDRGADGRFHLPAALRERLEALGGHAEADGRWRAFVAEQLDAIPSLGFGRLEVDAFDLWHFLTHPQAFEEVASQARAWLHWARGTGQVAALERYLAHAREQAARASRDATIHARLAVLHGGCLAELGHFERAETLLRDTLARTTGDERITLFGLEQLGQTLFRHSRFDEAEVVLSDALALADRGAHEAIAGSIQGSLGQIRLMLGRPEGAADALARAIASKTRRGHLLLALPDQNALALVRIAMEHHEQALAVLDDALAASHALQERNLRPYLLHARAVALLESGRAHESYDAALSAVEALLPNLHGAVAPLLKVTLVRAMHARGGARLDRDALRDATRRALEAGGGTAWYAVLAVAEALGEAGVALYDHLAEAPVEGHVLVLARRRRRGRRSSPPGEPRALIAAFAPWLLS